MQEIDTDSQRLSCTTALLLEIAPVKELATWRGIVLMLRSSWSVMGRVLGSALRGPCLVHRLLGHFQLALLIWLVRRYKESQQICRMQSHKDMKNPSLKVSAFVAIFGISATAVGSRFADVVYVWDRWTAGSDVRVDAACYRLPSGWVPLPRTPITSPVHLRYAKGKAPTFASIRDGAVWNQLMERVGNERRLTATISMFTFREVYEGDGANAVIYDSQRNLIFTGTNTTLLTELAKSLRTC